MARITDTSRIESMEEAAMALVVDRGYAGTSVLEIAKRAGVSAGYLYSHYKSKEDLVLSVYEKNIGVFDEFIDLTISTSASVSEFARLFVRYMFLKAGEFPSVVRFLLLLVFDQTFNLPAMRRDKTREQCKRILMKGVETGEIDRKYTPEDVYIVYFSIPFKLLEHRLENSTNPRSITEGDIERVSEMCVKALR